ncbi:MAG: carboxypeptidase-like regulatory domain-containing protein [Gemmatimonadales bacterium]|nr:carboxypeptidase-like regulatory domain-containing protein [Gemmatimonadales bacterium]
MTRPLCARTLPLAVLLALAGPAAAQQPGGTGTLTGTVFDSLVTGAPLADAEVWVAGTELTSRTDKAGRFRLVGVPAGKRTVTFFHPSLTELDLSAPSPSVDVAAGGETPIVLFTPSAGRVYQAVCGQPLPDKLGAVLGVVRDERGRPLGKVSVVASWSDYVIAAGQGLRRQEREAGSTTDESGRYLLCGVPGDVPVLTRYSYGESAQAFGELNLQQKGFLARSVTIALGDDADAAPAGPAGRTRGVVRGTVRTPDGKAVVNAEVTVLGALGANTMTDAQGRFRIDAAPVGSQVVEVRGIGYRPVRSAVAVSPGRSATLSVLLDRTVVQLNPLTVVADDRNLRDITGFDDRMKSGNGYFFNEEQIRRRNPARVNDMFVTIPGAKVSFGGAFNDTYVEFQRSLGNSATAQNCPPVYYIDGVLARGILDPQTNYPNPDLAVRPNEIRGIEVYPNVFTAPPQYQPVNSSCGVILIWTKRGGAVK